ncbi:excalibur calcium-binding domain-containing protein [Streptosporangium fragile]|uniref:excalibur calcium-binding domain-containing protein n=1 Tax=Streptosporangium fragile TaxID=46186 RepID=UPI0031EB08FE
MIALVVVVLITGVLGTIAVLMTRNPDMPLGGKPPSRLAVPIHFAPVTEAKPGPCTAPDTYPDDLGQTCYTVAAGVTVNAVWKIEAVQEKSGAYSVRIAFAPAFREQISDLTEEAVKQQDPVRQQIAIVVGQKVVAAPRVVQAITDDSLSIAGALTKEQADAMVARLRASDGTASAPPGGTQPSSSIFTPSDPAQPGGTQPTGGTQPGTGTQPNTGTGTQPSTGTGTQPNTGTGTQPSTGIGTQPNTGTGAQPSTGTGTQPNTGTGTQPTGGARPTAGGRSAADPDAPIAPARGDLDPQYRTCRAAVADGYGPYYRDTHEEYNWYIDADKDGVACDR